MKFDFLIVGAGIYGCSLARILAEKGKKVLLLDKEVDVGGLCFTEKEEDYYIHKYGAHIFHTDSDVVWKFVNRFSKFNRYTNSPKAVYDSKLYSLPFNMNTFYEIYGVTTEETARYRIGLDIVKYDKIENLEEQAISLVGKKIYKMLVKGYTEKQWGAPCKKLPASIIKRLPLRFTFDDDYFSNKYEGIPSEGYTKMMEKMIDCKNIKLVLGCDYFMCKKTFDRICNKVVYCGKVDELYGYRYGKLDYRSLTFIEKKFDCSNRQCTAVLNYTDKTVGYTRTIEHKHFVRGSKSNSTIVTYEFPCRYEEGKLPCYPMQDESNLLLYKKYADSTDSKYFFGGRIGKYKYLDMDKAVIEAMKDAKELLNE